MRSALWFALVIACSSAKPHPNTLPDAAPLQADAPAADAAVAATCADVTAGAPVVIAIADHAAEYTLAITAKSISATSWGSAGNEAVVLEVAGAKRGFIGHVVLHQ